MCRGDRPVAPTGAGDGDQPGCPYRCENSLPRWERDRVKVMPAEAYVTGAMEGQVDQ